MKQGKPVKNPKTVKLHITMPKGLLERVDTAAARDFETRSELIRSALLWYLRPDGKHFGMTEPEALLEMLKREAMRKGLAKMMHQQGMYSKVPHSNSVN